MTWLASSAWPCAACLINSIISVPRLTILSNHSKFSSRQARIETCLLSCTGKPDAQPSWRLLQESGPHRQRRLRSSDRRSRTEGHAHPRVGSRCFLTAGACRICMLRRSATSHAQHLPLKSLEQHSSTSATGRITSTCMPGCAFSSSLTHLLPGPGWIQCPRHCRHSGR